MSNGNGKSYRPPPPRKRRRSTMSSGIISSSLIFYIRQLLASVYRHCVLFNDLHGCSRPTKPTGTPQFTNGACLSHLSYAPIRAIISKTASSSHHPVILSLTYFHGNKDCCNSNKILPFQHHFPVMFPHICEHC